VIDDRSRIGATVRQENPPATISHHAPDLCPTRLGVYGKRVLLPSEK
jgi:hypothetical protein